MIPNAAPVAYFVYRRLDHVRKSITALAANEGASDTDLLVFSDGPRTGRDAEAVAAVREYLTQVTGFRSVSLEFRRENWGLARTAIAAIGETLKRYDRVIMIEDDNLTSPYFLRYMNEALDRYQDEEKVMAVTGYVYPAKRKLPETFFVRGADIWGWGTWRRAWAEFEPDGMRLLEELHRSGLRKQFDFNDSFCLSCMLEAHVAGMNDSWAVRWYASAFLKNKLTLYPGTALVRNIGNDASGTHEASTDMYDVSLASPAVHVGAIPVEESVAGRAAFEEFFRDNIPSPNPIMGVLRRSLPPRQVVALRRAIKSVARLRKTIGLHRLK